MATTPRKTTARKTTARKTAAPRNRTAVSDKPPTGGLDLDSLDYAGPHGPYPFRHGGRWFELKSAAELDVNILADLNRDPMLFFAQAMNAEDHAAFSEIPMPAYKLRALLDSYAGHYDLGN